MFFVPQNQIPQVQQQSDVQAEAPKQDYVKTGMKYIISLLVWMLGVIFVSFVYGYSIISYIKTKLSQIGSYISFAPEKSLLTKIQGNAPIDTKNYMNIKKRYFVKTDDALRDYIAIISNGQNMTLTSCVQHIVRLGKIFKEDFTHNMHETEIGSRLEKKISEWFEKLSGCLDYSQLFLDQYTRINNWFENFEAGFGPTFRDLIDWRSFWVAVNLV